MILVIKIVCVFFFCSVALFGCLEFGDGEIHMWNILEADVC